MAIDKRIHELVETSDKSGKFIAVDDAGLSEALKFDADNLITKAFTDTLYVKLAGDETVNGVKTWNNNGIFEAGILVNLNGITVTGNSNIAGTLGVDGLLTVTIGGFAVTGASSIAGKLTISTGGIDITGNQSITGTIFQTDGVKSITLSNDKILFSNNGVNYFHGTAVGGYFAFVTASRALSVANANLVLRSNQESYFNSNLGIGIDDPAARLHIVGTGNTNFILDSSASNTYLQFQNAGASKGYIGWTVTGSDGIAILNSIGTTNFIVHEDGNVGIGFASPTERLWIEAATLTSILVRTNSATNSTKSGTVRFTTDIETRYAEIAGFRGAASDRQELIFSVFNGSLSEAMRINYLGYVGIKASSPETRLDFGSPNDNEIFFQMISGGGDNNFRLFMQQGTSSVGNGDPVARIGLRYNSGDFYNCGIEFKRGGGTEGGFMSLTGDNGTAFVNVAKERGVLDVRITGANDSNGFGGVLRVSNLDLTILATEESGQIEFYKSDVSVNGAGVVSRIRSYAFDAGGTFHLGFHTGDSSSVAEERFTMSYLGSFLINNAPSNQGLIVDASVVKNHGVRFDVGGVERWFLYCNGTAEGGSDSGSNITFASYTDAGAFKTGVMNIDRATSRMGLGGINASYQLDVQTNQTTEAAVVRFYNDYKNKIGKNLILRQAEDTPSGSPPAICLQCQDGNGTEVGSLGYDTGSGFRLIDSLSSKKFKKNIKASKIKGIEKLKAVRPKNYKWKGRTPEEEVIVTERGQDQEEIEGYLIEDLEVAMPDVVSIMTGENGEEIKGYSATGIIKYLHKGILELEERLAVLEP